MPAAPARFTPPPARFRARLSAWVLALLALTAGTAEILHFTFADHHAADACPQEAGPPATLALHAPHSHGCDGHHTLADHETRDLAKRSPEHGAAPAVFQTPAAAGPPPGGARLGRAGQDRPPATPRPGRHLIRGPPSLHAC